MLRLAALVPLALAAGGCHGGGKADQAPPDHPRHGGMDTRHTEAAPPPSVTMAIEDTRGGAAARSAKTGAEGARRPFPRDDAQTALTAAARGLRVCGTGGGPEEIRARLRFEPSGEVSDVDLAPRREDPITSCVKEKLDEVAVLPFDGEAVTVKLRVRL